MLSLNALSPGTSPDTMAPLSPNVLVQQPTPPPPPTPSKTLKTHAKRPTALSVLISEEYQSDPEGYQEGLLPYLQGTPSPSQSKFDEGLMSRSTSSASASGSSGVASASSSCTTGVDFPAVPDVAPLAEHEVREEVASHLGTVDLEPAQVVSRLSPRVPEFDASRARPVSSATSNTASAYDGVLDDWLEAEDGEGDTSYIQGEQVGDGLKSRPRSAVKDDPPSSPLDPLPPVAPSIAVNGSHSGLDTVAPIEHAEGEEEEDLPLSLIPLSKHVQQGNAHNLRLLEPVAEGQYGPVFAARMCSSLTPNSPVSVHPLVAVKVVAVAPDNQPKFDALLKELELLRGVTHENVLFYDGAFVVNDPEVDAGLSLWLEMQLLERSLADVLAFMPKGLVIKESVVARFASDVSSRDHLTSLLDSWIGKRLVDIGGLGLSAGSQHCSPRCALR